MSRNDRELAKIFSAAGRYILEGGRVPSFVGDEEQARVTRNATLTSRRLYEVMCNEAASFDAVVTLLEEKRAAAAEFERIFGRNWRL